MNLPSQPTFDPLPTPSPDAAISPAPAFQYRPMCLAAAGVLLGLSIVRLAAPPLCYLLAMGIAMVGVVLLVFQKRGWAVCLISMALGLFIGGCSYPADGVFRQSGSLLTLPDGPLSQLFNQLREGISSRIGLLFSSHAGVATGMLLGDKGGIGQELLTSFDHVGILHLLAISGLHVSVLAGALSLLFRRGKWSRFIAVALFLLLYAGLTNFSPSVIRAGTMLLCAILAVPLGRRADPPSSLALAFVAILLLQPRALFYTGFQLSFAAVYGLILLTPSFMRLFKYVWRPVASLLSASMAVLISTAPIMALHFGRVQLMSLITNLLVLPLVPLFLIPAFAGVAISFVCFPLGKLLASVAQFFLNLLVGFASAGGALDVSLPIPNGLAILLYLTSLAFVSPLCLWPRKKRLLAFGCLMVFSLLLWMC